MSDPIEDGRARAQAVDEALGRARDHGRAALGETVAALAALLDAATLATSGEAGSETGLAPLADSLARLRRWLDPEGDEDPASVLSAVQQALDDEIRRWEARSQDEPEARTILRAFLAVREVFWELGSRTAAAPEPPTDLSTTRPAPTRERPQRVNVEG